MAARPVSNNWWTPYGVVNLDTHPWLLSRVVPLAEGSQAWLRVNGWMERIAQRRWEHLAVDDYGW